MRVRPGLLLLLLASLACLQAAGADPAPLSVSVVRVGGAPFGVALSLDDQWAFLAMSRSRAFLNSGIGVLERHGDTWTPKWMIQGSWQACHCEVSHDGKLLLVSAITEVLVFDVAQLETDRYATPLATIPIGPDSFNGTWEATYLGLSRDDRTLFVAEEAKARISVYDFGAYRDGGWKRAPRLGEVPAGNSPVALLASADGQSMYSTSEVARRTWAWPIAVPVEGSGNNTLKWPEGALMVIDVAKARTDPLHAVTSKLRAGGSPVRLALSADGTRLYLAARGTNELRAYDTAKLRSDPERALVASAIAGSSPVPVAILGGGSVIVVGNSDRFNEGRNASLSFFAAPIEGKGFSQRIDMRCAGFPREFAVTKDGAWLLATYFDGGEVSIVDTRSLSSRLAAAAINH